MPSTTPKPTRTHLFNLDIPMRVGKTIPKFYALRKSQVGIYCFAVLLAAYFYVISFKDADVSSGLLLASVIVAIVTVISYVKAPYGWIKDNNMAVSNERAVKTLAEQVQKTLNPIYQIERQHDYTSGSYINSPFDDLATNQTMIDIMINRAWENYCMTLAGKKGYEPYIESNWTGFAAYGDGKVYNFNPKFLDAHTYIVEEYEINSED